MSFLLRFTRRPLLALAFLALSLAAQAQSATEDALQALTLHAPVIFAGEVLSTIQAGPIVTTRIRVDRGLRGVRSGETFSFRQWHGADPLPLYLHQQVILFLHQPNAAGITSTVFGNAGMLNITGGGRVHLPSPALVPAGFTGALRALDDCREPRKTPRLAPQFVRLEPCAPPTLPILPFKPVALEEETTLPVDQVLTLIVEIIRQQNRLQRFADKATHAY